jgi:hypothetical protein
MRPHYGGYEPLQDCGIQHLFLKIYLVLKIIMISVKTVWQVVRGILEGFKVKMTIINDVLGSFKCFR